MSPKAGFVLLDQIEPRLRAVIPRIKPVGAEDEEELLPFDYLRDVLTSALGHKLDSGRTHPGKLAEEPCPFMARGLSIISVVAACYDNQADRLASFA